MAVRDIFSIRRPLDPPIGVPRDFIGTAVWDPELANLGASPTIEARLDRDTMPIPSAQNREGYYGDRHFEYWLSGLSDYLKIKATCGAVDWAGASLLDFGGATGRVARHFYAQDDLAEIMICDININNVDWVLEYLPSGVAAFKNSAEPPLPIPDDYFDVVAAFSVFTHISEYELGWLYELRRILKPNGILYTTVHNDDTWAMLPSTWLFDVFMQSEDFRSTYRPGCNLTERLVFEYSSESAYNCNTFHPNAYLHRVWSRVFTILDIRPVCHHHQSAVVLRKEPRLVVSRQSAKHRLEERTTIPRIAGHHAKLQELQATFSGLSETELLELIPELVELLLRTGMDHGWLKKRVCEAFEAQEFHVTQNHSRPQITDVSQSESRLTQVAKDVGADWKHSSYYDAAEQYMEDLWTHRIWPFIKQCDFSCVVDLAAGHGRNTRKLRDVAGKVYVVDINEENILFCRERFVGDDRLIFIQNDGCTLNGIPDGEVTLIYCFDAMIHFDSDIVRAYLTEFYRVLKPGGYGFCHHSNYDKNPTGGFRDNPSWRNFMSQNLFLHYCSKEGLEIMKSQVIDWDTPSQDCLTLFRKPC